MIARILIISLYTALIVYVALRGFRSTRSFNDFFLGGGRIGPWMTAFTYGAAYFSAVLFIGFAGKIGWEFGLSGLWIAAGNTLVGVLGVWWLLGWRIKKMSLDSGAVTMGEFLEKRYQSPALKLFSSITVFLFFIPYSAAVFIGLAYLFRSNFSLEYWHALVFMGVFTAFYLAMGGYRSMALLDVVFSLIMISGVSFLLFSILKQGDGFSGISARLAAIEPELAAVVGPPGWWALFCLVFLTSAAPFGMPQLLQKFYAIRDRRSIRTGMIISTLFAALISAVAYFMGASIRVFLNPENAPAAFSGGKPVFDALVPELFIKVIPPSLSILFLLLILSASMSTLAALVLLSSSTAVKDIYAGFINRRASDGLLTLLMRFTSTVFVVLSVILAWLRPATIVSILAISWGAIGSVFLGPFLWGILSNRVEKKGALASSTLGLLTCLLLYFNGSPPPEAGTIGMAVSLIACPLVSLVFGGKKQVKSIDS